MTKAPENTKDIRKLGDEFGGRRFITPGAIVSAPLYIGRPYPGQVIHFERRKPG